VRSELDTWEGVARVKARCEDQAASEGLKGFRLFFRAQDLFMKAAAAQPTYRQINERWAKEQALKHPIKPNPLIEALRQIADGHNDPRKLATEALQALSKGHK
jgi:hypothetical protein